MANLSGAQMTGSDAFRVGTQSDRYLRIRRAIFGSRSKLRLATAGLIVCLASPMLLNAADTSESKQGFKPLYNGENLDGWEVQNGDIGAWQADGEFLSCTKSGGGWLRTEKIYSDFVLKVNYRIPADGNSGIGIRFPKEGNPAFAGMEIQILDDDSQKYKDLKAGQYTGGIYHDAAAKRGVARPPGEWNSYEIRCVGREVTVTLNGQQINQADLDNYTKSEGDYSSLADRPELGHVGMQSHGSRVDFRNILIKDLSTTTDSGLTYCDVEVGEGAVVPEGATVTMHYTGRLIDGTKFDSSRDRDEPFTAPLNRLITGWQEGVPGMRVGGRRKLIIPAKLGYGRRGAGSVVPPNATLVFDVEVIDVQ